MYSRLLKNKTDVFSHLIENLIILALNELKLVECFFYVINLVIFLKSYMLDMFLEEETTFL